MVDEGLVADVDLLALQHRRHRNDDGKLLRVAPEVVGHRQHRAIAVAHQHHLGGAVEQLRVGARDVEAAEGGKRIREQQDAHCERDDEQEAFHERTPEVTRRSTHSASLARANR